MKCNEGRVSGKIGRQVGRWCESWGYWYWYEDGDVVKTEMREVAGRGGKRRCKGRMDFVENERILGFLDGVFFLFLLIARS